MSLDKTIEELSQLLAGTPPDKKIHVVQEFLKKISDPIIRGVAESMFILGQQSATAAPAQHHAVALIHGIRTFAPWQEKLASELRKQPNTAVYPIGYGYLDVVRFWCPFFTRRAPVERVERELRNIRTAHKTSEISVVAHSFGTYVIGKILRTQSDIELQRLLLCGSVLPTDFRWDTIPNRPKERIVNDVGTKDLWPVLADAVTWGYGSSGTFGFKTVPVRDRFHNLGHSDFFTQGHIDKFWVPFIAHGIVTESDWDNDRPTPNLLTTLLAIVPWKSLTLISVLAIVYVFWARYLPRLF